MDLSRPHQFPKDAPGEVLAWVCQACGEVISEIGNRERTPCKYDWRNTKREVPQVIETKDIGLDLPVVVADDDFFEYLHEHSVESPIDINELAIYFAEWMKENC